VPDTPGRGCLVARYADDRTHRSTVITCCRGSSRRKAEVSRCRERVRGVTPRRDGAAPGSVCPTGTGISGPAPAGIRPLHPVSWACAWSFPQARWSKPVTVESRTPP
jgi:hypothetical protein